MVSSRDPFKGYWWPPTRGSKGHGFNHLVQGFIHVRWLAGFLNHQPALKFPSDPGLWIGVICLASKNMPQQTVTFLQKILHPWPLRIQRWKDQPKLGKKGKTHAQLGLLATKFVKKSHFVYIHPESLAFIAHDILTIPKGKHRLPWYFSGSVYKHLGWQHFTVFDCFFSPCHFFGWRGRGDKIDDVNVVWTIITSWRGCENAFCQHQLRVLLLIMSFNFHPSNKNNPRPPLIDMHHIHQYHHGFYQRKTRTTKPNDQRPSRNLQSIHFFK